MPRVQFRKVSMDFLLDKWSFVFYDETVWMFKMKGATYGNGFQ